MFKQIELNLQDLNLTEYNSGTCLHNPNGFGLSYYKLKEGCYSILKNRLPFEYQTKLSNIFYCIMTGPGKLTPHIDTHTTTAINYYIKGGNGATIFYKRIDDSTHPTIVNSFTEDGVVEVDRFVANDGDCYILDVTQIHNVDLPTTERHFINFMFKDKL